MINPILVTSILATLLIGYLCFWFKLEAKDTLTIIILALTATALVWTVTNAQDSSAAIHKANIRPVVLRSGVISTWPEFQERTRTSTTTTNFLVNGNIATNFSGYVITNEKKYPFFFSVAQATDVSGDVSYAVGKDTRAGWVLAGKPVFGTTFPDEHSSTSEKEGIYIFYKDIEGSSYKTFEDTHQFPVSEAVTD
jgi:hypothetical protein